MRSSGVAIPPARQRHHVMRRPARASRLARQPSAARSSHLERDPAICRAFEPSAESHRRSATPHRSFATPNQPFAAPVGHLARHTGHLPRTPAISRVAPIIATRRRRSSARSKGVASHDFAVDESLCALPPTPVRHPLRRSRIRVFATRPATR
jgi:hypothetical protein